MSAIDHEAQQGGERRLVATAGCAALLYGVGTLAATPADGPPVESASAAQIRAFLAAHAGDLRREAIVGALAIPLVLLLAGARAALARRRLPGSLLPEAILGGGVLVAVWSWVVVAFECSTQVQALDGTPLAAVDDATLRAWYATTNVSHVFGDLAMLGVAIVMGATSLAGLRAGIVPRAVAWLGLVAAACGLVGAPLVAGAVGGVADVWFGGLFGWVAWTFAVGASLLWRVRRPRAIPLAAAAG